MSPTEEIIAVLRNVPRQLLPLVPIPAALGVAIFLSALAHVAVNNGIA